jgi:hypothetical protein
MLQMTAAQQVCFFLLVPLDLPYAHPQKELQLNTSPYSCLKKTANLANMKVKYFKREAVWCLRCIESDCL